MRRSENDLDGGNVFADLGLPDAGELQLKADLAVQLHRVIQSRRLTQTRAAELLGTTQPQLSKLFAGQLRGFSVERLLTYLVKLGRPVTVQVGSRTQPQAAIRVIAEPAERAGGRSPVRAASSVAAPGTQE